MAAGVDVGFQVSNSLITQENVQNQLLIYGALTALVETVLKAILTKLSIRYPGLEIK